MGGLNLDPFFGVPWSAEKQALGIRLVMHARFQSSAFALGLLCVCSGNALSLLLACSGLDLGMLWDCSVLHLGLLGACFGLALGLL